MYLAMHRNTLTFGMFGKSLRLGMFVYHIRGIKNDKI